MRSVPAFGGRSGRWHSRPDSPGGCRTENLAVHLVLLGGVALAAILVTGGGLMGSMTTLSDRETRMMAALYSLPHGAAVEADGAWRILP